MIGIMKPGLIGAAVAAMSSNVMTFDEYPAIGVARSVRAAVSGYEWRPNKDRTKVKAARKQNVQRQIQAKARKRR